MKRSILRVLLCCVAGAVTVGVPACLIPELYVSTSISQFAVYWPIAPETLTPFDVEYHWERIRRLAFDDAYLSSLANRHKLHTNQSEAQRLGLVRGELVANIRDLGTWKRYRHPTWKLFCCFIVGFSHKDAGAAQTVARDVVNRLMESGWEYTSHVFPPHPPCPEYLDCRGTGIEILDPASLPTRPTHDPLAFTILGAALGIIAGVIHELGRNRGSSRKESK